MADWLTYPRQDLYETELAAAISASDTSLTVATAPSFTLSSGSFYIVIDPAGTAEVCKVTAISSTTLTVTRAIATYDAETATAAAHAGGVPVIISNNWKLFDDIKTSLASKVDDDTDTTITADTTWSSTTKAGIVANTLTTTQRDALASAPNGAHIYNSTTGQTEWREGGSWVTNAAGGSVANSSTTVAGKAETATTAESQAGTNTGGTGANLIVLPSDIAANVQDAKFIYAADAEASDTYVITLTPAPSAYATGQSFFFKANTANTGAATLNVNSLGAKSIVKYHNEALQDNDIESGSIVHVIYDGTNFQLQTGVGVNLSEANTFFGATDITGAEAEELTDGSLTTKHKHSFGSGTATRATGAGTGTQNIAHGLGVTPSLVRITAYRENGAGNSEVWTSVGTATSTSSEQCISTYTPDGSLTGSSVALNTLNIIDHAAGGNPTVANLSTLDATNITLNFTTFTDLSSQLSLVWEAFA